MKSEQELLTVREAARLLAVDVSTLRKWIMSGRVKSVKLFTKAIRVPRTEVEALIQQGTRQRVEVPGRTGTRTIPA